MSALERGYGKSRERVEKSVRFSRSCFNCEWYYKTMEDDEEVCQNQDVTKYDVIFDGNRVYCSYWKLVVDGSDSMFHNRSRRAALQKDVDRYFDSLSRAERYRNDRIGYEVWNGRNG